MVPAATARQAVTNADCITYEGIPDAPKGKIPRDDVVTIRRDRLSREPCTSDAFSPEAIAGTGTVTIPVAFHVLRKDTSDRGWQCAARLDRVADRRAERGVLRSDRGRRHGVPVRAAVGGPHDQKASWFKFFYAQGGTPRFFRGSHKEIQICRSSTRETRRR